jgi:hypothetical protein
MSTSTISILQFFYFGSVLAATEYFFASEQADTGLKFIQAEPWMIWSEAHRLRLVSIPVLVVFLAIVPLLFAVIAWRVRHRVTAPTTAIYFGTLFSRFSHSFFWWEIVNVVRRLAIALALRAISPSSAVMPAAIIVIICLCLLLQTTFKPWKRTSENIMDPISSVLLLLSLFASFANKIPNSTPVIFFVLALDIAFVVAAIAIGIYQMTTGSTEYQHKWRLKQKGAETTPSASLQFAAPLLNSPIIEREELFDDSNEVLDLKEIKERSTWE